MSDPTMESFPVHFLRDGELCVDGWNEAPTAEEMARADRETIVAGTSSLALMERAGSQAVAALRARGWLDSSSRQRTRGYVILCGPGNNGGDGLVLARLLLAEGVAVTAVLTEATRYSPETIAQAHALLSAGGHIYSLERALSEVPTTPIKRSDAAARLSRSGAIVDALLGTGQREAPRGSVAELVELMLETVHTPEHPSVIALDVPTGTSTDTGEAFAPRVIADLTIALERVKRGTLQFDARRCAGEIIVVPLGIEVRRSRYCVSVPSRLGLMPRVSNSHKGTYGEVLLIAGSRDMPGACALAAHGALRTGAGLVVAAKVESAATLSSNGDMLPAEAIRLTVPGRDGAFCIDSLRRLRPAVERADAVVVGPGITLGSSVDELFGELLSLFAERRTKVVLDADALTLLARRLNDPSQTVPALPYAVLTPHPGEMGKLLGCTTAEVQRERYRAAEELSKRTAATVVLKGASTVTFQFGNSTFGERSRGWINTSGNPFMATGGSGDVLSGAIAASIAQAGDFAERVAAAVFLHGRAGDLAHTRTGGAILAREIADELPRALNDTLSDARDSARRGPL